MKTSEKGIELIKHFESLHDGDLERIGIQPKLCPANIWTTGYGHAIIDPDTGLFIRAETKNSYLRACELYPDLTEEQANYLLKTDLIKYENIVNNRVKASINQNQFDALVSHTYNTGGSDNMFKYINTKEPSDKIRKWFIEHYITVNGTILKGLVRRRETEANLFFTKI